MDCRIFDVRMWSFCIHIGDIGFSEGRFVKSEQNLDSGELSGLAKSLAHPEHRFPASSSKGRLS